MVDLCNLCTGLSSWTPAAQCDFSPHQNVRKQKNERKKRQERVSASCACWCVLGVRVVTRVGGIFSAFPERVHLLVHLEDINQSFRHGV